jgi:hypothetical protein
MHHSNQFKSYIENTKIHSKLKPPAQAASSSSHGGGVFADQLAEAPHHLMLLLKR